MTHIIASTRHRASRWSAPVASLSRWLAALLASIAARRERKRFRWELKRITKDNPHLIDDIGLTAQEVEAEIARLPFWQR